MMDVGSGEGEQPTASGPADAWSDRKAPPPQGPSDGVDVVFMGMPLAVGAGVVAPRLETELLVRAALELVETDPSVRTVLDMCCGSGAIALVLAGRHPEIEVWACDLLDAAVDATRRNALRHGLQGRVRVARGDLFGALAGEELAGRVDLVVANPPYISTKRLEGARAELLAGEPREAFDGGPYGLTIHQRLIREAPAFLKPGGWLLTEFGHGQERQIAALVARQRGYHPPLLLRDEHGEPRVAVARWQEADSP